MPHPNKLNLICSFRKKLFSNSSNITVKYDGFRMTCSKCSKRFLKYGAIPIFFIVCNLFLLVWTFAISKIGNITWSKEFTARNEHIAMWDISDLSARLISAEMTLRGIIICRWFGCQSIRWCIINSGHWYLRYKLKKLINCF